MANNDKISEFNKILNSVDYSKSKVTVFADFLSLSAYSIAQPFYKSQELEEKYLSVAKTYKPEQLESFVKLLVIVVEALEEKFQDFLGQVYSINNMGNAHKGQFFTPYHVSKLMAELTGYNVKVDMANKDILTLSEPCCGSGGMVIAFAESMKESGYNYQNHLYVEAVDIDDLCFKMSYIQLSLLGIPARVIRGNTLSMEYFETLYTPVYFLNGWDYKLNCAATSETAPEIETENTLMVGSSTAEILGQLSLF